MDFPLTWISCVKACIPSTRFSLLISGTPSDWISFSRGIQQEDPLSPYLFVLTSQILTITLNKAIDMSLIPYFDSRLTLNFNHLVYADDLILVMS